MTSLLPVAWKDVGHGSVLAQLPHDDWDYVEIAHPSNLETSCIDGNRLIHQLFSGDLEKGVIRRARRS